MSEFIYRRERVSDGVWSAESTGEEIVRCRDCRHIHHRPDWQPDKRFKPQDLWLCEADWCMGFEGDHPCVEPDGFCAWGERKEGEE